MVRDLGRDDWLKAARTALLKGGVEAVRVEKLARKLGVTKGSFYWHFKDRVELLELLLREWEGEMAEIVASLGQGSGRVALLELIRILIERARLSEEGDVPSDAAIYAWASVDPKVARRVNRAEKERLALLCRISGEPDRSRLFYLIWLGFVARGQRVPESRKEFPEIARQMLELLLPPELGGDGNAPAPKKAR
ncbi:MAG TPA: helix-turn-helix domain-containing protein [Thermoanaerobaculia bacterium]